MNDGEKYEVVRITKKGDQRKLKTIEQAKQNKKKKNASTPEKIK